MLPVHASGGGGGGESGGGGSVGESGEPLYATISTFGRGVKLESGEGGGDDDGESSRNAEGIYETLNRQQISGNNSGNNGNVLDGDQNTVAASNRRDSSSSFEELEEEEKEEYEEELRRVRSKVVEPRANGSVAFDLSREPQQSSSEVANGAVLRDTVRFIHQRINVYTNHLECFVHLICFIHGSYPQFK